MKNYKSIITAFIVFMLIIVSTLALKPHYNKFVYENDDSRFFTNEYAYKLYNKYINLGEYTDGNVYNSINSIHFDTSNNENNRLIILSITNLLKDRNIELNKELKNKINYNNKYYDGYYVISLKELNMYLKYSLNIDETIDVSSYNSIIDLNNDEIEVIKELMNTDILLNMVGYNVYFDKNSESFILYLNNYSSDYSYSKINNIEFKEDELIIHDEYYRYYLNDKTIVSADSMLNDNLITDYDIVTINYDDVSAIKKIGEYKHIFKFNNNEFTYLKSIKK